MANVKHMDPELQPETVSAPQIASVAQRDKGPGERHLFVQASLHSRGIVAHFQSDTCNYTSGAKRLNCEGSTRCQTVHAAAAYGKSKVAQQQ